MGPLKLRTIGSPTLRPVPIQVTVGSWGEGPGLGPGPPGTGVIGPRCQGALAATKLEIRGGRNLDN